MKSRLSGKEIRSRYKTYEKDGKTYNYIDDYCDVGVMHYLRLTDEEYDRLLGIMTDEDLNLILEERLSFKQKRKLLSLIHSLK